jgi:hypothetical protein
MQTFQNITNSGSIRIDALGAIHCKRGIVARVFASDIARAIHTLRGVKFPRGTHNARNVFRDDIRNRLLNAGIPIRFFRNDDAE